MGIGTWRRRNTRERTVAGRLFFRRPPVAAGAGAMEPEPECSRCPWAARPRTGTAPSGSDVRGSNWMFGHLGFGNLTAPQARKGSRGEAPGRSIFCGNVAGDCRNIAGRGCLLPEDCRKRRFPARMLPEDCRKAGFPATGLPERGVLRQQRQGSGNATASCGKIVAGMWPEEFGKRSGCRLSEVGSWPSVIPHSAFRIRQGSEDDHER